MSFDKSQQKIALALFIVGLVSASLLALADKLTQGPIAEAQREFLHQSITQVLPEHVNDPVKDMFVFSADGKDKKKIYPAKDKKGDVVAYAWEQIAPDGYSGTIRILIGVRVSGEIVAIRVTAHQETPGLGDGIVRNIKWLDSFIDKTLNNSKWKVKKDGGDFDQFTGATITPRAVVKAVHHGLLFYKDNQVGLLKQAYAVAIQAKEGS
jgi:electron transport complex protein RnfG